MYETQSILKDEIIELEQAKVKLRSNEIHLVADNKPIINEQKFKPPTSKEIETFISISGRCLRKDIKDHFKCKSADLNGLSYLMAQKRIVVDGVSDQGKDMFSINTELKNGTN